MAHWTLTLPGSSYTASSSPQYARWDWTANAPQFPSGLVPTGETRHLRRLLCDIAGGRFVLHITEAASGGQFGDPGADLSETWEDFSGIRVRVEADDAHWDLPGTLTDTTEPYIFLPTGDDLTAMTTFVEGLRATLQEATVTFWDGEGTNPFADTTAPAILDVRTTTSGRAITVRFDESLDTTHIPPSGAFTTSGSHTIGSIFATGTNLTINVSPRIAHGETLTLSYTVPSTVATRLQDTAGNEVAAFTNQTVDNIVPVPVPGAVRNLTPSGSVGSITWQWDAPNTGGAVVSYEYRFAQGNADFTGDFITTRLTRSFTIANLSSGTTYRVQVRARNATGPGVATESSATTEADVIAPTFVSATTSTDGTTIDLVFDENLDANSIPAVGAFDVQVAPPYGTDDEDHVPTGWTRTKPDPTVTEDVWRQTRTRTYAQNVFTMATAWGSVTKVTNRIVAPHVPTDIGVTGTDTPPVSITVTFATTGDEATGVELQWRTSGAGTWTTFTDSPFTVAAGSNFSETDVAGGPVRGGTYQIRARATNAAGAGPWYTETFTLANQPPLAPDAPTLTLSGLNIVVTWDAPASDVTITGYDVQYRESGITAWTNAADPGTTRSLTIGPFGVNETYNVRVRAKSALGAGAWSDSTTVSTLPEAPVRPAAPTVTQAGTTVTVAWTAPANGGGAITDYDVRYRVVNTQDWTDLAHTGTARTATITSGLTVGTAYEFQVRAENRIGESDWSPSGTITFAGVPDAPAAPTVTQAGATVMVTWAEPDTNHAAITAYVFRYRTDSPLAAWTTISSTDVTDLSLSIGNLTVGSTYEFQVRATNLAGNSAWSSSTNHTVAGVPGRIAQVTVTQIGTTVTLTWNAPSANHGTISGYDIQYRVGSRSWTTITHTGTSTTARVDDDITFVVGTTYGFRVRAINEAGQGRWQVRGFTYADLPGTPAAPTVTQAGTRLTVTWTMPGSSVATITDYDVRFRVVNADSWTDIPHAGTTLTTTIHGLTAGTAYEFQVRAENRVGESAWSSSGTITVADVPNQPQPVALVQSGATITATWTAPGNNDGPISSYALRYRSTADMSTWTTLDITDLTDLSADITGFTVGTTYEFQVQATNRAGSSQFSTSATAVFAGVPATIAQPTVMQVNTTVTLTWTAPSANHGTISSYRVEYQLGGSGDWTPLTHAGVTTTLTVSDVLSLTVGYVYAFRVYATNEAGNSAWSPSSTAFTYAAVPDDPAAPTVTQAGTTITVAWTAPDMNSAAITDYDVRYRTGSNAWTDHAHTGTALTTTVTGLTVGVTYEFQVRAENAIGESGWSGSRSITVAGVPATITTPTVIQSGVMVTLTWTAPSANHGTISTYSLEYEKDAGSWTTVAHTGLTTSAVVSRSLTFVIGSTYRFRIRATNEAGSGTWSNPVSLTYADVPDQVTTPTITQVGTVATLTWTAPSANHGTLSGYLVRYRKDDGSWTNLPHTGLGTTITVSDVIGLTVGSRYRFRVRATNQAGSGPWSPQASLTYAAIPDTPATPTVAQTGSTITLTWVAPDANSAAITDYDVRYRTGSNAWTDHAHTGTALTTTVTGLTVGSTYEFQVRAENRIGESGWSDSQSITVAGVPDRPVALTLTQSGATVTATWVEPNTNHGAITGYTLRTRIGTAAWTMLHITDPSDRSNDIVGLMVGSTYEFQIQATNVAGDSAWSLSSTITVAGVPATIVTPTVVQSDATVTLTWTAPSANYGTISGYQVGYRRDTGQWNQLTHADISTTLIVSDTLSLVVGFTYDFRIRAVNEAGTGTWSPMVSLTYAAVPDPPTTPTVTQVGTVLTIGWIAPNANSGTITDYDVRYRTGSNAWTTIAHVGTALTTTVTDLTVGTTYEFQVRAENHIGESGWSASRTLTVAGVPGQPAAPTVTQAEAIITVAWTAPSATHGTISGYTLRYRERPGA